MSLSTRLFLGCFLTSLTCFAGLLIMFRSHFTGLEERRSEEAFSRAVVQYDSLRSERQKSLRQAGSLATMDFAFKEAVSSADAPTIITALASLRRRVATDLIFFLDSEGEPVAGMRSEAGSVALKDLAAVTKLFFAGESVSTDLKMFRLEGQAYQAVLSPVKAPSVIGWVGLGTRLDGQQLDRLSEMSGLVHLLSPAGGSQDFLTGSFSLGAGDAAKLSSLAPGSTEWITLSGGNFLGQSMSADSDGSWLMLVLFPMAPSEQAKRDLAKAILLSGLMVLALSLAFARAFSRALARPLVSLRDQVREIAASLGMDFQGHRDRDEIREVADAYLGVAKRLRTELLAHKLDIQKLEEYKAQLVAANSRKSQRLFENRVLLAVWSEGISTSTSDYLDNLLDVILTGLKFEYGCVVIRSDSDARPEFHLRRVEQKTESSFNPLLDEDVTRTMFTKTFREINAPVQEHLLEMSAKCLDVGEARFSSLMAAVLPDSKSALTTFVSVRLQQGNGPIGSLHLFTELPPPAIDQPLLEFLAQVSLQVAGALRLRTVSGVENREPQLPIGGIEQFRERLRAEAERCVSLRSPSCVLLFAIGRFVAPHGDSSSADRMLLQVEAFLRRHCRPSDTLCRYGRDTYGILLPDTPVNGAKAIAESLLRALEARAVPLFDGQPLTAWIGGGELMAGRVGDPAAIVLERCEGALAEVRSGEGNRFKFIE